MQHTEKLLETICIISSCFPSTNLSFGGAGLVFPSDWRDHANRPGKAEVSLNTGGHYLRLNTSALGNCTKVGIFHVDVIVILGPDSKVTFSGWGRVSLKGSDSPDANLMWRGRAEVESEDAESGPWSGWEENVFFPLNHQALRAAGLRMETRSRTRWWWKVTTVCWPVETA